MQKMYTNIKNTSKTLLLVFVFVYSVFGVNNCLYAEEEVKPLTEIEKNLLNNLSNAFAKVAAKVKPSIVSITTTKKITLQNRRFLNPFGNDEFFKRFFPNQPTPPQEQPKEFKQQGLGSGFIFDNKGHILTNNHVIEGATELKVKLADGRTFNAKVVGSDKQTDIAVLKIEGENLSVSEMGNSDTLKVGHWVIAVGSPFGWEQTVSTGIVSAFNRSLSATSIVDFIQTDAAINPGNSGGPLLDLNGKVIGINTAISSKSGGNNGIGFAIPINLAKRVAEAILKNGTFKRGVIGVSIQPLTSDIAEAMGMKTPKGALVAQILDGPAKKAGIKEGDVIISVNGDDINTVNELPAKISIYSIGDKVKLGVLRLSGDKTESIEIVVEIASEDNINEFASANSKTGEINGLTVQSVNAEIAEQFGLQASEKGVIVSGIKDDSPASNAGFKIGDLIKKIGGHKINNINDFSNAVKNIDKKVILFWVKRSDSFIFITLRKD